MTPIQSTTPQALKFYERAEKILSYLAARWLDEKDYENIDSYMQPLSKLSEECGVQLAKMTKKPFGVEATVGDRRFHLFIKGQKYGYKRIA